MQILDKFKPQLFLPLKRWHLINYLSTFSYDNNRNNHNNQNHECKQTSSLKFLSGFFIGAISGYYLREILYCRKNENTKNLVSVKNTFTVNAKTLSGRRGQYNFISDVVDMCASSVVYIEIKDSRRVDYFSGQALTVSNGSGFIIDSNGLILTNAHVVINKPHTTVQVKLIDGRTFPGTVEDVDQTSDLATVRINCKNLTPMKLGASETLKSGEWVVALGSPLALSNTVTCGVVSSPQRASQELGLRGRDIHYIQTDAAITFGNSGGPLVNLDGEAIGINSMKVTAGISFAIPIDYAKQFLQRSKDKKAKGLASTHQSTRRYMGITMLTLTDDMLRELKQRNQYLPEDIKHGVFVWKVIYGSPAHIGGLAPSDIITNINGKEVKTSSDVYNALSESNKELNVTVYRGYNQLKLVIKPEEP